MELPDDIDYRLLFDSVPDPCLVLDPELRIVEANRAYLATTLTRREELIGRDIFEVFPDNPDEPEATGSRNARASLQRVLKSREPDAMAVQKYDIRRPEAEGGGFEERYWSVINSPVLDGDGGLSCIIHRVQDVTEFVRLKELERAGHVLTEELRERALQMDADSYNRSLEIAAMNMKLSQANGELEEKNAQLQELNERLAAEVAARVQAQEALHEANLELARSNRDLELFASVASHDLNEPLHTIRSYAELLTRRYRGKLLDHKAERYLAFIMGGADHMSAMIHDLLLYSRLGTRAKPFAPVRLDDVLDLVLNNLKSSLDQSRARLERAGLPTVQGDDIQLAQLFQNLVSNAVKFRKENIPLQIMISCQGSDKEWLFGVHDNGIGLEPRFFDQIFDVFRRLHTREEYEGSGIGLAICKRIVEHHGGRIWVNSTPGEGTSFYFTLPRETGPERQDAPAGAR